MSSSRLQPGTSNRGREAWRSRDRSSARGSRNASIPYNINVQSKRQMEHIASVSRSSGLEKDGDTLKDFGVQEEYREFLQGKVDDVFSRYPRRASESEIETKQRVDAQENVLILFRKLREGISSSRRNDVFALEVYEISLYLTAIFDVPRQTTSIIPHLLPALYLSSPPPHHNCTATILVSLVHHLVAGYPSQSSFRQYLDTVPFSLSQRNPEALKWINALSQSLRTRNYVKFEELTRRSAIARLFESSGASTDSSTGELSTALASLSLSSQNTNHTLPRQALEVLVASLRRKARAMAWDVIRASYREFSCAEGSGTQDWLARSLCLRPLVEHEVEHEVQMWLKQQDLLGYVRKKEGADGRWIVCKVR